MNKSLSLAILAAIAAGFAFYYLAPSEIQKAWIVVDAGGAILIISALFWHRIISLRVLMAMAGVGMIWLATNAHLNNNPQIVATAVTLIGILLANYFVSRHRRFSSQ